MSDAQGRGCLGRGLRITAWTLGILAAGVAILYIVLAALAGSKEQRVNAAWSAAGLPLQDFLSGMPDRGDGESAKALTHSAAKLGIVLDTTDYSKSVAAAGDREAWKQMKASVQDLNRLLESPELSTSPIPETLQAFLLEKAPVLEEIRTGLQAEVPTWRSDISKGYRAEIPPVLGQLDLCRLLVADAQAALARNDEPLAARDLDAAWRLSEGLVDRPELIGQLAAMAMRRMTVVALRHLDAPASEWEARLAAYAPSRGILKAYQCEAAMMGTVANEPRIGEVVSPSPGLLRSRFATALVRPYLRLCCAGAQEILLDQIHALQGADPCIADEAILKSGLPEAKIPSWNLIARIALPNMDIGWGRAKHMRIAGEITRKVMALKAARTASGAWPASLPGLEDSVCAGEKYTFSVTPEGAMTLSFSAPMPSEQIVRDFKAPHEYRTAPRKK